MKTYEGKAKRVTVEGGTARMMFKDDATAFNGKKHALIDKKGRLNSQITELLFQRLEERGVATHLVERLDDTTLRVQAAHMAPLEVVVRFKVDGSLGKRTGKPYGFSCEPPVVEFYLKDDDLGDPMLNDDHIAMLELASTEDLKTLRRLGLEAATHLRDIFSDAGMDLFDIKFEYGRVEGKWLLADEISPDTCRLRDVTDGRVLDKDVFRKDLGNLTEAYEEVLARLSKGHP